MEMKMKKKINIKKAVIIFAAALVLCAAAIFGVIQLRKPEKSETYAFLTSAMEKTEAAESFLAQITSKTQIAVGGDVQVITTRGYISSEDELSDVYVFLNTVSESTANPSADYNVTLSMHSDGEKVYDDSTGTREEIDMTAEEFEGIIGEYRLYRYTEKNVTRVEFDENELEQYEGGGILTVFLTKPEDTVIEGYDDAVADLSGEEVTVADLEVKSAYVTYTIYDDMVTAQTCTFAVEYITESGEKIDYSVTNQVVYLDDYEADSTSVDTFNDNGEEM